jgi:hypothetical protein
MNVARSVSCAVSRAAFRPPTITGLLVVAGLGLASPSWLNPAPLTSAAIGAICPVSGSPSH